MLIELVGRESLPNAIALQSTAFNLSRVLGPALIVPIFLLFPKNGEGWVFLLNGISFIAIIIGLFFVRTLYKTPVEPRTRSMTDRTSRGNTISHQQPLSRLADYHSGHIGHICLSHRSTTARHFQRPAWANRRYKSHCGYA